MSRVIQIAVCDDEPLACNIITGGVQGYFSQNNCACEMDCYSSATALLEGMGQKNYDLILLDIDMPECDGIQCGKRIRELSSNVDIVYISSREDRVFEVFSVRPEGFIRKSKFFSDLDAVLSPYCSGIKDRQLRRILIIKTQDGTQAIPVEGILYIESLRKQQIIHLMDRCVTTTSTMGNFEEELADSGFFRIHKSFLINYSYISIIGKVDVTMTNGDRLDISRNRLQDLKSWYLNLIKGS